MKSFILSNFMKVIGMKSQKVVFKSAVFCLVSFVVSDLNGSAGIKAIRASFASRINFLEMMRLGNAFAKASGDVSFEEFHETKTGLEISLTRFKRQRSAAFVIQKRIDVAEKLLAEKAAVLSSPFPCNNSKQVLEEVAKDKALLATLMPEKKTASIPKALVVGK